MDEQPTSSGQRLTSRAVLKRYGVTYRTLARWLAKEGSGFPKPLKLAGRLYFDLAEIEAWERRAAAGGAAA